MTHLTPIDPKFAIQVERLHRFSVYCRWLFVITCWLSFGVFGIWGLRKEIELWQEYFTWVALRYAIVYNPVSTLCISFCMGVTAGVLVWQSRNILIG
ncbi:MAG: hypothetical protein F6K24_41025, partial [Okeania sp. SIO2D1]|nr:hypothetical protein [Okeania sp. SIO2D1]